jgi:hypothetical protein
VYGSLHISESITRLSVAGVVLWLSLSATLATVVGVAAWSAGHATGARYSPAVVRKLQAQAYVRGVAAGSERASRAAGAGARVGVVRRKSYERGYAAGYRAGRSAAP